MLNKQSRHSWRRSKTVRAPWFGVIYFDDGVSGVSAEDRSVLEGMVTLQRQRGGILRIVGHESAGTSEDPIDAEIDSFEMSLRRANAVAGALVELGAPAGSVQVMAASDNAPVYEETTPSGRAGNRRVEVYLQ